MNALPADAAASVETTGKPPVAARLAVAFLFLGNGVLLACWVSRIPAIQSRLGMSHATLGFALLGVALGALVSMPFAGWCSARFGSHRVTTVSGILYCAMLPFLALAPSAWWLGFALFCFGTAHGGFDVAMNVQAVAVEERYRRPIMSSFHAFWSLGGLAGAALGGVVASAKVEPFAHFAGASLLAGGAMLVFAFPRLLDAGEAAAHESGRSRSGRSSFAWPLPLVLLGVVAFCIMMGEGAMADWSAIFLRDTKGADEGGAAAGYAAFSVAMAVMRFSGDALAKRLGPARIVRYGSALAMAGLLFALFVAHPIVALAGFAAVGAGYATIVPQVMTAAGRTPGIEPGPALATVSTLGYTGFLIGPPLIGFAAERMGLHAALGIIVATTAAAMSLAPSVGLPAIAVEANSPSAPEASL